MGGVWWMVVDGDCLGQAHFAKFELACLKNTPRCNCEIADDAVTPTAIGHALMTETLAAVHVASSLTSQVLPCKVVGQEAPPPPLVRRRADDSLERDGPTCSSRCMVADMAAVGAL